MQYETTEQNVVPGTLGISVGTLLGRTKTLIRVDAAIALTAWILFGGIGVFSDISGINLDAIFRSGSTVVQYFVIRSLCQRHGLVGASGPGSVFAFIVMGLVYGLGVIAGIVLLIIPGVYLAARWSAAGTAVIAEHRGPIESLGESWRLTAGHATAIILATIILWLPGVLAFILGLVAAMASGSDEPGIISSILINFGLFASLIANWYFGVAVYSLVSRNTTALARIFE